MFGDLAVIQLAALEAEVARFKADLVGKDVSYARLAIENEEHRTQLRAVEKCHSAMTKDRDRERARAGNLEAALEDAMVRIRSLEESARRLLSGQMD